MKTEEDVGENRFSVVFRLSQRPHLLSWQLFRSPISSPPCDTAKMGGRCVAAALVVLGIISSMNLQVEGRGKGKAAKEEAKKVKQVYLTIVNGGKQNVNDTCKEVSKKIVDDLAHWAGEDPKDKAEEMIGSHVLKGQPKKAAKEAVAKQLEQLREIFEGYEKNANEMCSLKRNLKCEGGECVDCSNKEDTYCLEVNKIAEADDPPIGSSGGGWSARHVNGALVAALLALFALSV